MPLETPAMENLTTLEGKYGDEGDKLLFRILNSGDYLKELKAYNDKMLADESVDATFLPSYSGKLNDLDSKAASKYISEKGLRYDLTVPFARFVVMNRNDITFPFKRYQMQPVWRADRPQKGRYREFWQCDADVVGTDSLLCEAEIIGMIRQVFTKLGLTQYSIKINNRKILTGIAEAIGADGKEGPLCVAIDKLDKIGWEKVQEELQQRGFENDSLARLAPLVNLKEGVSARMEVLSGFLNNSPTGLQGLQELEEVFGLLERMGTNLDHVDFDPMLARGLSYYTGAIFEVKVHGVSIGSVSGGGRYDNLTGVFGLPGVPGVGFSFGVDRLYDVLEELNLFPIDRMEGTQLLLAHFDQAGFDYALKCLPILRDAGIRTELYPEVCKLKKQLEYASKKDLPFVGICGDEEIATQTLAVKALATGTQETLTLKELIAKLQAAV